MEIIRHTLKERRKLMQTKVKKATISTVGDIYFLVDGKGKLIMPAYRYMLFLRLNGKSINTNLIYCKHLKLFFDWLTLVGLNYLEAVKDNDKVLTNLGNFKFWIKYPNYNEHLIPIGGFEQKRSSSTINQIMTVVLNFYDFLIYDEGLDELNVYKEVRTNSLFHGFLDELSLGKEKTFSNIFKEKVPKKKLRYVTRSQYKMLSDACNNQRDRIIIGLMYEGGLRISEVIGLNIVDLRDIRNNKIYITLRDDPNNPDAFVKYGSEGSVFVSDALRNEIIDYLSNVLIDIKTDYFIINLYSRENRYKPMKRDTLEDIIERLGKKTGIPVHPHMFRHGIAVDMLAKGCDMVQIKDKLRHKNISTTSDIYAEVNDAARKDAMQTYFEKVDCDFTPDSTSMDELFNTLINEEE